MNWHAVNTRSCWWLQAQPCRAAGWSAVEGPDSTACPFNDRSN